MQAGPDGGGSPETLNMLRVLAERSRFHKPAPTSCERDTARGEKEKEMIMMTIRRYMCAPTGNWVESSPGRQNSGKLKQTGVRQRYGLSPTQLTAPGKIARRIVKP